MPKSLSSGLGLDLGFRLSLGMACEELLPDILTQSADSICAALATVRHLLHIRPASSLHLPLLLWCWRFDVCKLILGYKRHDVLHIDTHLTYLLRYILNMFVIYRRDVYCIHLNYDLPLYRFSNTL